MIQSLLHYTLDHALKIVLLLYPSYIIKRKIQNEIQAYI